MTNSDEQKFRELMAMMQEVFSPDKPISTQRVEIYFQHLKPYRIEDIDRACHKLIDTNEYPTFPMVAKIISAMTEPEAIDEDARLAWQQALNDLPIMCMSERCNSDCSEHPLTSAVEIAFGGWEKFSMTDSFNEIADRRHFIDCYKLTARKKREDKLLQNPDTGKMIEEG